MTLTFMFEKAYVVGLDTVASINVRDTPNLQS